MYRGADSVEWLFQELLQVDRQWSDRVDGGFTWWADRLRHRVPASRSGARGAMRKPRLGQFESDSGKPGQPPLRIR